MPESIDVKCAIGEFVRRHEKTHIVEEVWCVKLRLQRSQVEWFAIAQDGKRGE